MKYKCIKQTIIESNIIINLVGDNIIESEYFLDPKYYAPYIFTTEDGVDIYRGDYSWCIYKDQQETNKHQDYNCWFEKIKNCLFFSTRELAQAYIDKKNKLEIKIRDVIKCNDSFFTIFVLSYDSKNKKFSGYGLNDEGEWSTDLWLYENSHRSYVKLTDSEWLEALEKEANKRGYKEGVLIKSFFSRTTHFKDEFKSSLGKDGFWFKGSVVMNYKGEWAEIVEDKKQKQYTLLEPTKIYQLPRSKFIATFIEEESGFVAFGITCEGEWFKVKIDNEGDLQGLFSNCIEAKKEEWEEALMKQAEKRGYKPGTRLQEFWKYKECILTNEYQEGSYVFQISKDNNTKHFSYFAFKGVSIMCNGEWIDIVKEEKPVHFSISDQEASLLTEKLIKHFQARISEDQMWDKALSIIYEDFHSKSISTKANQIAYLKSKLKNQFKLTWNVKNR